MPRMTGIAQVVIDQVRYVVGDDLFSEIVPNTSSVAQLAICIIYFMLLCNLIVDAVTLSLLGFVCDLAMMLLFKNLVDNIANDGSEKSIVGSLNSMVVALEKTWDRVRQVFPVRSSET